MARIVWQDQYSVTMEGLEKGGSFPPPLTPSSTAHHPSSHTPPCCPPSRVYICPLLFSIEQAGRQQDSKKGTVLLVCLFHPGILWLQYND